MRKQMPFSKPIDSTQKVLMNKMSKKECVFNLSNITICMLVDSSFEFEDSALLLFSLMAKIR
jgi:hypothetical protein